MNIFPSIPPSREALDVNPGQHDRNLGAMVRPGRRECRAEVDTFFLAEKPTLVLPTDEISPGLPVTAGFTAARRAERPPDVARDLAADEPGAAVA